MKSFREWLSDNLIYVLLIAGVLVVLVGLFFGVRAFSKRDDDTVSRDPKHEISTLNPDSTAEIVSAAETPVSDELLENRVPEVTKLMTMYYDALGRQDLAAVKTLTDTLPESEAAHISSSTTTYSDIRVYTKPGPEADSYVVYTRYYYKDPSAPASYPGLTQTYVKKFGNSGYKIVFSKLDEATEKYIQKVTAGEDVQALINEVKVEYNAAKKAAEEAAANTAASITSAAESGASPVLEETSADLTVSGGESGTDESQGGTTPGDVAEVRGDEPESDETYDGSTGLVIDNVNVRIGPDRDSDKLGSIPEGSEVEVSATTENGWRVVRYGDLEGYIYSGFLEYDGDDGEEAVQEDEEENARGDADTDESGEIIRDSSEENSEDGSIQLEADEDGQEDGDSSGDDYERSGTIRSDVNLRSGAGFDYNVIGTVPGGASVTVYGQNEKGWWHISTGDQEGYVGQSYIDVG